MNGRLTAICSEWYCVLRRGPQLRRSVARPFEKKGRLALPPPGVSDALMFEIGEAVGALAADVGEVHARDPAAAGARRATFHDWMLPRLTSSSGVRIETLFGSGIRPLLRSGPVRSGMPLASVPYQPAGLFCWNVAPTLAG